MPVSIFIENNPFKEKISREMYIEEKVKDIHLDTMPERIRFYRIKNKIGGLEMGRLIGMKEPRSYEKTYENPAHPYNGVENIRKICKVLAVDENLIFDDYIRFIAEDYKSKIKKLRELNGMKLYEMDKLFGLCRGTYSKWEKGISVPNRKSVEKILAIIKDN